MNDHQGPVVRIIAFVPDLMDRSRFPAAVEFVAEGGLEEASVDLQDADLVVVDLSRLTSLDVLDGLVGERGGPRRDASSVLGFAPHVDGELADAARSRGCTVYARSVFFRRLVELLAERPAE